MFKIIKIFILVIIGAGIFYGGFYIGANVSYWYLWKKETQWTRDLADDWNRFEKEDYERAMADTYGGKTPQETLQMFIDAVEKGDYELASKYFIEEKRGEWRGTLLVAKNIDFLLNSLKEAQKNKGEYSKQKDSYSIHEPALTSFIRYPNGIWKLTDI